MGYFIFLLASAAVKKTQTILQPLRSLSTFRLIGQQSKSEVREELEKLVSHSLAGKPGTTGTGSLQW